jgi:hypothetical protein
MKRKERGEVAVGVLQEEEEQEEEQGGRRMVACSSNEYKAFHLSILISAL